MIHAGIYYSTGSLKACLCRAGRDALYAYCDEHGVPYQQCGKLIVATSESQIADLHPIRTSAHANGCVEIELLSRQEVTELTASLAITSHVSRMLHI